MMKTKKKQKTKLIFKSCDVKQVPGNSVKKQRLSYLGITRNFTSQKISLVNCPTLCVNSLKAIMASYI